MENLAKRYKAAGKVLYVVIVDNCCTVRDFLKKIFGQNLEVLLDDFHFQKRWDLCLAAVVPSHPLARLFKAAVSRALKEPVKEAKQQAIARLKTKGKTNPTNAEVLKETKIFSCPSPEQQLQQVRQVVDVFKKMDEEEMVKATRGQKIDQPILFIYNEKNTNNIHKARSNGKSTTLRTGA